MNLPKPKAVIFDWDDTIVDTWEVIVNAVNTTLEAFGHKPWSDEEARGRLGAPARVLFTELFGADKMQKADDIFIDAYARNIHEHLRVQKGVENVLGLLDQNGVYLCVVSSKRGPLLRKEATHLGFDKYFKTIIGAGDASADKPDPACIRMALAPAQLVPGRDIWFVGDSYTDMACGQKAGCSPLLIETKPPPEKSMVEHPPLARFSDYEKFKSFLLSYMNG